MPPMCPVRSATYVPACTPCPVSLIFGQAREDVVSRRRMEESLRSGSEIGTGTGTGTGTGQVGLEPPVAFLSNLLDVPG